MRAAAAWAARRALLGASSSDARPGFESPAPPPPALALVGLAEGDARAVIILPTLSWVVRNPPPRLRARGRGSVATSMGGPPSSDEEDDDDDGSPPLPSPGM